MEYCLAGIHPKDVMDESECAPRFFLDSVTERDLRQTDGMRDTHGLY